MSNTADPEHFKNLQDAVLDVAILEKERSLDHLPSETKQRVIDTLFVKTEPWQGNWGQNTPRIREDIVSLAKNPQFGRLTEEQQSQMLHSVTVNANPTTARHMQAILDSSGYVTGSEEIRKRILDLANENATFDFYNTPEPKDNNDELIHLLNTLNNPKFWNASEEEQHVQLDAFHRKPPAMID
jgi:hypothetical protein